MIPDFMSEKLIISFEEYLDTVEKLALEIINKKPSWLTYEKSVELKRNLAQVKIDHQIALNIDKKSDEVIKFDADKFIELKDSLTQKPTLLNKNLEDKSIKPIIIKTPPKVGVPFFFK